MDIRIKFVILFAIATTAPIVIGNNYAYLPYDDFYYQRMPQLDEITPHQQSFHPPRKLQNNPLWSEFWDAYNYKGPLEEEPVMFPVNKFIFDKGYQHPTVENYPQRYPQEPETDFNSSNEDSYDRYRKYFFRRYGNNFDRRDPRF